MPTALEIYEAQLEGVADVCADPWFAEQLRLSRAGDELAWRRINGSCLRLVLEIAKRQWQPGCPVRLLDLIEEGNRNLVRTIKQFEGSTAQDFLREVRQRAEQRLILLVQHPDLAR
jgi:DNA-directed RNA polymerase sigma subunit (sigma70/sigma32)